MAKFSISQTSKSFDTLNSELSTANFALAHLAVPLKECAVEFLVSVQARAWSGLAGLSRRVYTIISCWKSPLLLQFNVLLLSLLPLTPVRVGTCAWQIYQGFIWFAKNFGGHKSLLLGTGGSVQCIWFHKHTRKTLGEVRGTGFGGCQSATCSLRNERQGGAE